jgi:hypothetical protein
LLTDGITISFIKSVQARTDFSKNRGAYVAETVSEQEENSSEAIFKIEQN